MQIKDNKNSSYLVSTCWVSSNGAKFSPGLFTFILINTHEINTYLYLHSSDEETESMMLRNVFKVTLVVIVRLGFEPSLTPESLPLTIK